MDCIVTYARGLFYERKNADVLLLSSVLQYLQDTVFVIETIKTKKVLYIIINRIPFFESKAIDNAICIQQLNESIYGKPTSFVCRIMNQDFFISALLNDYEIEIDQINFENLRYDYHGDFFYFRFLLLRRK